MFTQRITAKSITVTGTGNAAVTAITVPSTFTPAAGCVYDILVSAQVPVQTDGTILAITNGTTTTNVLQQMTGNYARARALGWRKVIRVQYFDDPGHFNLIYVRG